MSTSCRPMMIKNEEDKANMKEKVEKRGSFEKRIILEKVYE